MATTFACGLYLNAPVTRTHRTAAMSHNLANQPASPTRPLSCWPRSRTTGCAGENEPAARSVPAHTLAEPRCRAWRVEAAHTLLVEVGVA